MSPNPILTDIRIAELLSEVKVLPDGWRKQIKAKPKASMSFAERELQIKGRGGSDFRLFVRESLLFPLDFTVGLRFVDANDSHYVLRRFNGPSHQHTNHLEKREGKPDCSFRNEFHIHVATERYQRAGLGIDGFAEITDKFSNRVQALELLISHCGIVTEEENDNPSQMSFF